MKNDEDIEDKIKLEEQRLARILNKKRGPFPTNKRWSGGFFNSPLQKTSSQDECLSSSTKSKNNSAATTRSRHDSNTNISPTSSPSEPEIKQIVRSQSISEPPKIHSTSSFKSSFLKNELNDSQEQEFIMWANEYLDSSLQVETLIDFTDGVRLIELLQTLTGKRVGRYSRTPKLVSQKIDNVNVAIDFMEKELKIKLLAFNQRAYVDGNRSMVKIKEKIRTNQTIS